VGLIPFVPTEHETTSQRLARVLKPLLLIFLITMAISYYYDVYSTPQDSQQVSNQSASSQK